tara:strand:+ start:302 stop:931 length:630 start_codon:yes stop_codon:yes gene_type:complete
MKIKICNEDKVFPYLVIDDFYSENEQELIWKELTYHQKQNNFQVDLRKERGVGSAKDENGNLKSNSKRIYLDLIYKEHRNKSNILSVYQKIFSPEVCEAYKKTTPSYNLFRGCNRDQSLVSYYENKQGYREHFDRFMHSALVWFFKEPKKFKGGNLTFTQPNKTLECKHNRLVLFPSYYLHCIDEVTMPKKYRNKGLGRYCLTHFYDNK